MPIPITKYRCKFKCGKWAMHTRKAAINHEGNCYKNPKNKTCQTCNNEVYYKDSDDYTTWFFRGCKIDLNNDWLEDNEYDLTIKNGIGHINGIRGCFFHNIKETTTNLINLQTELLNLISEKINNSKTLILEEDKGLELPFFFLLTPHKD